MQEDKDFELLHVEELRSQGGTSNANRYMMTPDSFYMLLMDIPDKHRSARQTFVKYHAFLVKVIKFYDDFQLKVAKLIDEEKQRMLATKDTKIDNLEQKIDKQSEEMKKQSEAAKIQNDTQTAKIDQLLAFGNKLVGQNENIQLTLDMTREELGESLDYLVNKSYHSTIDPTNELKVTHVAALAPNNKNHVGKTILVRGQRMQIDKKINQYYDTHIPVIDMTYNANAINLIENAKQKFKAYLKAYVAKFNIPIIEYNIRLKKEIIAYNKKAKKNASIILRQYNLEKRSKLTMSAIPINFNNTSSSYKANEHIAYETVVQTIIDMNTTTQKSPVNSD